MIFQILVFHGVLLTFIALLVRFSGNNAVLAGSKESGIKNLAKFNKWAGNRLLFLPILAFGIAQFSVGSVGTGILGLGILWFAIFALMIRIGIAGKMF